MTEKLISTGLGKFSKQWKNKNWSWYLGGNINSKNKILLLHGWNTYGTKSWVPFLSYLIEIMDNDVCILALDMPGFGDSDEPAEVWGTQDYSQNVYEFVTSLYPSFSSWTLLGHSFGGAVSASIASAYPKWCSKLVLVAPAIVREKLQGSQNDLVQISQIGKKILPKVLVNMLKFGWRRLVGAKDYSKTSQQMEKIMNKVISQDMQFLLKNIFQPVLLVWGEIDKYTPIYQAHKIQKLLPVVALKILPQINHGVHLHSHKKLADWTKDFLISKS